MSIPKKSTMKTTKKTTETQPYRPAERRRVLQDAQDGGVIAYDRLDPLLVEACATPTKLRRLVRAHEGVEIVDSSDPSDPLRVGITDYEGIDQLDATDPFALYADRVREAPRLDRFGEYVMARRMEFARERMSVALTGKGLSEDEREQILERGTDLETLRERLATPRSARRGHGAMDLPEDLVRGVRDYNRLRGHLVERNLYLVVGMSYAYRTYAVPMMDLIQEGNTALIRAVEKFDYRKGVRFGTYAAWWVRQAVERLITASRGMVRVPNYLQQKMRRLRREGKLPRNRKDMDIKDVSAHFDITPQAAARLMATDRYTYSLDGPMGDGDDTFASALPDEVDDIDLGPWEKRLLGERLDELMDRALTDAERDILTSRFGLGGAQPQTLDQIGTRMSVSRERVRQMQVKALAKLGKPRVAEGLQDFL